MAVQVLLTTLGNTTLPAPASTQLPAFDHVFVIVEENHDYSEIVGNPQAPYINGLATQNGLAVQYSAVSHPSLPNYLALTGGSTFGVATDCAPTSCPIGAPNIADRLEGVGKTWKAYMDAMPSPCGTLSSGTYAVRHDPFVYYDDIRNDPVRCSNHVVPYPNLATDLTSASTTPNFAWITPDVCNDMHDCQVAVGDTWLQNNLPAIVKSPAWTTQKSVLLITWDEGSTNHVATLVVGPSAAHGYQSTAVYNHYSLLKTVESGLGLAPLTSNDANASPMSDFFLGSLTGKVTRSSNGAGISGASVTDSTSSTSTMTDASGAYTLANLAPGSHSLTASATGFSTSAGQIASVTAGQGAQNVNFSLVQPPLSASPNPVNRGGSTTATWSGISSPSPSDWLGLYTVGAPDGAGFLSSRYTNGATGGSLPFSIPASLTPGTYELRLYSNDTYNRLATTQVTVQAVVLSASPSTINPGRSTIATWSGIRSPTPSDWLGIYTIGAPDGAGFLSSRYTNGATSGSLPFSIPASLSPGTYELRLYSNDTYNRLATIQVTVQTVILSASPNSVNRGGSTTVTWSGISSPTPSDWLGLYSVGAPDGAGFLSSRYTNGATSGSLPFSSPASLTPGTYELRLYSNDAYNRLATIQVTVQAVILSASPNSVNRGGSTTATWSGISTPTPSDWLGLYSVGAPDGAGFLSSRYTNGAAGGSLPFSIPASLTPRTYELRLYSNDTYNRLASTQVTVQ